MTTQLVAPCKTQPEASPRAGRPRPVRPIAPCAPTRFNRPTGRHRLPADREYLRALRAAEMAVWEKAHGPAQHPGPSGPTPSAPGPSGAGAKESPREAWAWIVIVLCALVVVADNVGAMAQFVAQWHKVTELVRAILV